MGIIRSYRYWKFKRLTKKLINTFHEVGDAGYDTGFCFDELRYELNRERERCTVLNFILAHEFESIPELHGNDHVLISNGFESSHEVMESISLV